MKLRDPVIEFRGAGGALCAKSTTDHRWYKVQGITKTLDSILCCRNRSSGHNMISMDLYNRAVRDLNEHPDSFLDWVPEYVRDLNAPESKGRALQQALLKLNASGSLTLEACRRTWDRNRTAVDAQCKSVFNGNKTVREVGPVSRLVLTQLQALYLTPVCAGLRVAGIPAPDRCSAPGSYTYHNGCMQGCKSIRGTWGFYTEVDLVAHDQVTGKIVLLELKTRNKDVLDQAAMWRYNAQAWQTWMMFLLTYPSMAERSAAYLVIVRPGTNLVPVRSCSRPTISRSLREKFPWLTCFCPQVLNCLAPTCVNMRVENRRPPGEPRTDSWVDPTDLVYRNMRFNLAKGKNKPADAPASQGYPSVSRV
ncbi:hypothetical protein KUCAC02_033087 [Chaenocephalus aceratus]|nr:hypothetical protein KUCAC02_033087 [Chaenocephalus aceratus]